MNAKRILEHYERIADAPDAIRRLRGFILDLAVRGKLAQQDPDEESASDLMSRIAAEKARLESLGEVKAGKPLPPVEEEAEFEVPANWVWTRLGVVSAYIQRGKSPRYATSDGPPVVSQRCVQWGGLDLTVAKRITFESLASYEAVRFLRDGDLLWNSTGTGTIGRVIRVESPLDRLVCDSHVTVVRCVIIEPEYIRIWLRSDHVYGRIEDRAAGSTNQIELTAQMATSQVVPLPPLAEQRRIVAKVDELMALCDRLEAARIAREATRDRLAAASLARISDPDAETFQDDVGFVIHALPIITARPDQIKLLRRAILNLAVRGKLVEPQGDWISSTLGQLGAWGSGGTPRKTHPEYYGGSIPWLVIGDLNDSVVSDAETRISQAGLENSSAKIVQPGAVLIAMYGSIGKLGIAGISCATNQAIAHCMPDATKITTNYLFLLLRSLRDDLLSRGQGVAQQNISQKILHAIAVRVPSLSEQRQIAARVDELMVLCDRLEASIVAAADTRCRLLEVLIANAIASGRAEKAKPA